MFQISFLISLQKDLDLQEDKKERANKVVTKLTRDIKSARRVKGRLPEEDDIKVREMRDFNKEIMKLISIAVQKNPNIAPIVNLYFNQAGLPPPPSPGPLSTRPSSSSSINSSYSAR